MFTLDATGIFIFCVVTFEFPLGFPSLFARLSNIVFVETAAGFLLRLGSSDNELSREMPIHKQISLRVMKSLKNMPGSDYLPIN